MADLPETPSWEGVYQIEEADPVQGGPDGVDNQPHKNLANRSNYLKEELESHAANDSAHRTPAEILAVIKTIDGTGSGLDADTLDGVELSAIQAEIDSDISAHTANASAHHTKYTNANAIAAMGSKSNSNPLNHDRHTPATILSDLKTVDGPGSGLDADTLDGVELSAIRSEIDGDISTHAGNASAHHTKYTNANAIAAMGSKANSNPLNHNRYTDSEARSALAGHTHNVVAQGYIEGSGLLGPYAIVHYILDGTIDWHGRIVNLAIALNLAIGAVPGTTVTLGDDSIPIVSGWSISGASLPLAGHLFFTLQVPDQNLAQTLVTFSGTPLRVVFYASVTTGELKIGIQNASGSPYPINHILNFHTAVTKIGF